MERRWSGRREGKNGKSEGGISVGGEWMRKESDEEEGVKEFQRKLKSKRIKSNLFYLCLISLPS